MEQTHPRPLLVLSGLFLTALVVRVIYFIELSQIPYFDIVLPVYDHFNFDQGGLNFAAGDVLARSPNNSYSPFTSIFWEAFIFYLAGIFMWFTAYNLCWEPLVRF